MPTKTDILIIGGGVIGACAALYLTRAGQQVTLVEKADICAGASLGNACWVAAGYSVPTAAPGVLQQGLKWMFDSGSPFHIKPRLNVDLLKWLWAFRGACTEEKMLAGAEVLTKLNHESLAMFRELAQEPNLDFDFVEAGILHVHLSEKYRQAGEKSVEFAKRFGVEASLLDRPEMLAIEPNLCEGIESGVYFPQHAHIDPAKFVEDVANQASKEGATLLTQTDVTGFKKNNKTIESVQTSKGTIEAKEVILAAGAWSLILAKQLGAPILMEPAKGYSITVKKKSAEHGPTLPLSVDDAKVAITPLGQNRFRFSSTLELAGFDASVNPKRIAVNREALQTVLPDMENLEEGVPWSGYRPLTPDGLPYIGRSERVKNLIFATGHGMLGITHGPITGKLLSEVLTGQEPSTSLEAMRPERF